MWRCKWCRDLMQRLERRGKKVAWEGLAIGVNASSIEETSRILEKSTLLLSHHKKSQAAVKVKQEKQHVYGTISACIHLFASARIYRKHSNLSTSRDLSSDSYYKLTPDHLASNPLHGEQDQEGYHEREQTGGFGKGETQNGVREELTAEGWVAGDSGDQGTEDRADSSSGSDETCGGDWGC